jgi:hypothetical protein
LVVFEAMDVRRWMMGEKFWVVELLGIGSFEHNLYG